MMDGSERRQGIDDIPAMRVAMLELARTVPAPDFDIVDLAAGAVPLRLYRPAQLVPAVDCALPLLLFLHGGGWILGDLDTHDPCCRWLCANANCAVLAVGYRLAPEHPYPAALDDVLAALAFARANARALGIDPTRIAVGGESAGGNLAAALTLSLRRLGEEQPRFQLLIHPVTDLSLSQPSIDEVALPGLSRDLLELCVGCYAGDVRLDEPRLSPLAAGDLSGLPPALVVTVETDPLRDDGEMYALALARAGIEVNLQRLPGLPHGFMVLPITQPEVGAAFRLIGERVSRYFRLP